jgi:CDP-2,3-bis-(O-geranylgeranyl)-sn-glycerol synthase
VLLRALELVYFMAPAYVANMAAPLTRYWKGWNRPICARYLGDHKTVIGFAAGLVGALATTFVQHVIGREAPIVDYEHWVGLGLAFGLGAMGGDSAKSLVKRRLGIPPGRPWIPFDQVDFVLGALLLVAPRATLGLADVAIVLGVSFGGHVGVNHAAYWLGIRDVEW